MPKALRPLIAGNWKMHGTRQSATQLALAIVAGSKGSTPVGADLLVCPPFPHLNTVGEILGGTGVALGAQDCHAADKGAHTGDVAAGMLADMGCSHVILGHSERRANHGESDAAVRAKADTALAAGLVPIICVGETESERLAGSALAVVERQLAGSVPSGIDGARLVIAYEPVWAIGTGRTPSRDEIAEMHGLIREWLTGHVAGGPSVRVLYGGSVKPTNAAEILAIDAVDGALVGGASLDADAFLAIARGIG